jgi:hypothetical protein
LLEAPTWLLCAEAGPDQLIHGFADPDALLPAKLVNGSRHVVFERDCRTHASIVAQ